MTAQELHRGHPLLAAGGHQVATELLAGLDAEHPVLAASWPVRERVMAATWLAGYRSARTRRAYAGDLAAWLDWLAARRGSTEQLI